MSTQEQKTPEQLVIETKAKLFDAIEANSNLASQVNELSGALQKIVEVLGLTGTDGKVTLDEVVSAVESLATQPVETDEV